MRKPIDKYTVCVGKKLSSIAPNNPYHFQFQTCNLALKPHQRLAAKNNILPMLNEFRHLTSNACAYHAAQFNSQ